mmetsp:Transcript_115462/g.258087  ORF Transcript_115462/g.258087 Transcript_115462/m.258087 type:complete len:1550 (-) Transcript_115462:85-4734(-)
MGGDNAVRKGQIPFDVNWELLTRDDIYRQRVFGTESGANGFIPYVDKRRLTVLSTILYICFLLLAMSYNRKRIRVHEAFEVNSAVGTYMRSQAYEVDPVERRWNDIENLQDLQSWMLNALPNSFQDSNVVMGEVRFTLRRMATMPSSDERFKALTPLVWKHKNGISVTDKSSKHDNTTNYGVFRHWGTDTSHASLKWASAENTNCPGGVLLDLFEVSKVTRDDVVKKCKEWCERLIVDQQTCRCWTLSGQYTCEFYHMAEDTLEVFEDSELQKIGIDPTDWKPKALVPKVTDVQAGVTSFWPSMKTFEYLDEGSGWRGTPGFVLSLPMPSQELLTAEAKRHGKTPPLKSLVVSNQLQDWIFGGLLSRSAAGLVIDFVTYNPNCEVFTWVQLQFDIEASGHVQKTLELSSLKISAAERKEAYVSMWKDLQFSDFLYLALLIVYLVVEIVELCHKGTKYLYSLWNWLTMAMLMLQVGVFAARYTFLSRSDFTSTLVDMHKPNFQSSSEDAQKWTEEFGKQALAYRDFVRIASLSILFVWLQLVHYLSDIIPRIGVLVDTMQRAMTPIIFLFIIIADVFSGFVIWAYLMFGKSVKAFSSISESVMACTEMLFGQVDAYYELQVLYPVSGIVFFVVYMFIFYFVLQNLSKAVVLVSYDDAADSYEDTKEQEESRRRAAESENSSDYTAKLMKIVHYHAKRLIIPKVDKASNRAPATSKYTHSPIGACSTFLFAIYCGMYVLMTYYMLQIYWANTLTASVSGPIRESTYDKVNIVSGQSKTQDFSAILSRQDTTLFLTEVLPKIMYNSSNGDFSGTANPLKLYQSALPEIHQQLVINNWNIVVGRDYPVRITARFAKMKPLGDEYVNKKVNAGVMIGETASWIDSTGTSFSPALVEAKTSAEILNSKTAGFIDRHCSYDFGYAAESRTKPNGFVCLLSDDRQETMAVLDDMKRSEFITNQTATVVVDFVTYNGYAQAFLYTAIVFAFQPSGAVKKDIITHTIRLSGNVGRVMLEILVIALTGYYLGQSFRDMYKAVLDRSSHHGQSCVQHAVSIVWAIARHFLMDPFLFLDLLSSVMMIVTMALWYDIVFAKIQDLTFPERPIWEVSKCKPGDWCSDSDVIFAFSRAGVRLKLFIRIVAFNTIFIFLRALKYLQIFMRMRMMFQTLIRGARDIGWFIVMMTVVLMGYVTMGHQLFGSYVRGFDTLPNSIVTCFQMFLGTFNYSQLKESDDIMAYVFFSYTYMMFFRYMLINMFFAIIDKSLRAEDADRVLAEKEVREERKRQALLGGGEVASEGWSLNRIMSLAHKYRQTGKASAGGEEPQPMSYEADGPISPTSIGATVEANSLSAISPSTTLATGDEALQLATLTADQADLGAPALRDEDYHREVNIDEIVHPDQVKKATNWRHLPDDMQMWAIETSRDIYILIEELRRKRSEVEANKERGAESLTTELDKILQEAESLIKERGSTRRKVANEVKRDLESDELKKLKEIHQDQESLAWYIMKREAELKKLEQMKALKQDRFDKMVQAAKSLINSQEDGSGSNDGPPALENGR